MTRSFDLPLYKPSRHAGRKSAVPPRRARDIFQIINFYECRAPRVLCSPPFDPAIAHSPFPPAFLPSSRPLSTLSQIGFVRFHASSGKRGRSGRDSRQQTRYARANSDILSVTRLRNNDVDLIRTVYARIRGIVRDIAFSPVST